MKYFLNLFLILLFLSCQKKEPNKADHHKDNTPKQKKTIILFDVSGSFDDYIPKTTIKIKKYIDEIPLFEDVTLRKIGISEQDKNFITELDLTTGFTEKIRAISIQCNGYTKKERERCDSIKQSKSHELLSEFKNRKNEFKKKVETLSKNRENDTDIITSINQSLRDFEHTSYDWRRIIIFSDMEDLTGKMNAFKLMVDEIDYLDEVLIFYAEERYADIVKERIIGANVSINHISITESGFNRFLESVNQK